MDSLNILTPGVAGAVIIGHTFVTKMMQTVMWRGPGSKAASMGVSIDAPSQHTHATHSFFIIFLIPSYLCGSAHNLVVLTLTFRTLTRPGTLLKADNWMQVKDKLEKIPYVWNEYMLFFKFVF